LAAAGVGATPALRPPRLRSRSASPDARSGWNARKRTSPQGECTHFRTQSYEFGSSQYVFQVSATVRCASGRKGVEGWKRLPGSVRRQRYRIRGCSLGVDLCRWNACSAAGRERLGGRSLRRRRDHATRRSLLASTSLTPAREIPSRASRSAHGGRGKVAHARGGGHGAGGLYPPNSSRRRVRP